MDKIMIVNLSIKKADKETTVSEYNSDVGMIKGTNTYEAPLRYMIKKLYTENKERFDKIIFIGTSQTDSAYDEAKEIVKNQCKEHNITIPDMNIYIKYNFGSSEFSSATEKVAEKLKKGDKIYIDTTGGSRNAIIFTVFLIRLLEYKGIKFEKAIYSVLSNPKHIEDVTELYKFVNIINAANTFTSYGNSDELEKIYRNTKNEAVKKTISAMKKFSDEIILCRTGNLDNILNELNKSLAELSKAHITEQKELLFKNIIDVIKGKFYITGNKIVIEYPNIIKWCLDNNLIQQAVTIYSERIPEYFYNKKFYTISKETIEKFRHEKSYFNLEYRLFNEGLMNSEYKINETAPAKSPKQTLSDTLKDILFNEKTKISETQKLADLKLSNIDEMPEIKKALDCIINIRKNIYDEKTKNIKSRYKYGKIPPTGKSEIDKILSSSDRPWNSVAFIVNISENQSALYELLDVKQPDEDNKNLERKLRVIDNLENIDKEAYKINIKVNQMQKIMRDYFYVKNIFRNNLNHASDDSSSHELLKKYMKSYKYNVNDDINLSEIKRIMKEFINLIEQVSFK